MSESFKVNFESLILDQSLQEKDIRSSCSKKKTKKMKILPKSSKFCSSHKIHNKKIKSILNFARKNRNSFAVPPPCNQILPDVRRISNISTKLPQIDPELKNKLSKSTDKASFETLNPFQIKNSNLRVILHKLKETNNLHSEFMSKKALHRSSLKSTAPPSPKSQKDYLNDFITKVINKPSIANDIIKSDIGYDPRQNIKILALLYEKFLQAREVLEQSEEAKKPHPVDEKVKEVDFPEKNESGTEETLLRLITKNKNKNDRNMSKLEQFLDLGEIEQARRELSVKARIEEDLKTIVSNVVDKRVYSMNVKKGIE
ncbi:unnamed protein product [Moneuplotes crassus]|uniref:Uncharacterized protein n=1 Tax=Euplotes crassus TaxID=5936 RepID=A0AAD1UHL5_EUPCR|nr:unnamed protein product [Moneuplotes crassus]